jgi:DNA-binding transcriptional LysR family regulator
MKLRSFDLNLLVAFDHLMREKNVSRAADALFLTQSAMSHSLNRLREQLDDPLLVATKGGMQPTSKAKSLEQPVREWLAAIEQGLMNDSHFDPATSCKQFVLASSDYVEYAFLPSLMRRLAEQAPGVDVVLMRIDSDDIGEALACGEIDAAIHLFNLKARRDLLMEKIAAEEPVVLMRTDHPQINAHELSLDQYLDLPHAVVDSMELSKEVQNLLMEQGLERRVQLRVPHFLSAPIILAESDMLATVPTYIARRFIQGGRLKIASLPLDLGYFPVHLYWHKLRDQDPAQQWWRQQLIAVGQELTGQRKVEGRDQL